MVINGAEVYPGSPCPHSTGKGCDDYAGRPIDPCDNFNCGWIIPNSPLPDWMKPDKAKVIVILDKFRWNGLPVDLAVPAGKRIPPRALNWLKQFAEQRTRPLIYSEQIVENGRFQKSQTLMGHGPPAFQQTLAQWQREGKRLW